jgi:hypothetical protein
VQRCTDGDETEKGQGWQIGKVTEGDRDKGRGRVRDGDLKQIGM